MTNEFKDHFSDGSKAYSQFRPDYPSDLFSYLASLTQLNENAWDCATGSGQSALGLSHFFPKVIATDASENQIKHAIQKTGIIYRVEPAETSSLENNSIDLITVAQAIHWFNLEAFATEANRVLKPNAVVAVWTYGLLDVDSEFNEIIDHLYRTMLEPYWPPERNIIENEYRDIQLPFKEITPPTFQMHTCWDLEQLIGYFCTWSAVKKFEAAQGFNPVINLRDKMSELWGEASQERDVKWPLILKVWVKSTNS